MLALVCVWTSGCRINSEQGARRAALLANFGSSNKIRVEPVKRYAELGYLKQLVSSPPKPSERTVQLLRRYNLSERYSSEPDYVIRWMKNICRDSPTMEEVHALAEIASIQAHWAYQKTDTQSAIELYATALVHAYQFLFDGKHEQKRNAYDPQFRNICDIYNQSLEGMLKIACDSDKLQPGMNHIVGEGDMTFEFTVELQGRWKNEKFKRFELTSEYEMKGIENLYHTYGLGVPLIAVYDDNESSNPTAKYYPPKLTLPMTAFCEVVPASESVDGILSKPKAILKLYDPLERTTIKLSNRVVPLESDITTPLAYHLDDPLLGSGVTATAAMLNAQVAKEVFGLYMLEPYDPTKIPVVMVHGLWSSPVTWMEMFNDLRANRDLRNHYQFWFYAYPTGQPVWNSARDMRNDLVEARSVLDPNGNSPSFNRMVLVGHSMGGLVSRMQCIASEDEFWKLISDRDFSELSGDPESLSALKETFFFEPSESVKRVITLATPLKGTRFSNPATQWVSQKLFTLPEMLTSDFGSLARENSKILKNPELLTTTTSVDSLAPDSPFFAAFSVASSSDEVKFHNILGNLPRRSLVGKTSNKNSDGIIEVASARAEDAESEIQVNAEHSKVHQHPRTILEVRRILLQHLVECRRIQDPKLPVIPATYEEETLEYSRTPASNQAEETNQFPVLDLTKAQ